MGIADHLGWAVAVAADDDHRVVDRRRIELVDEGLSAAPIHYDRGASDLDELAALIEAVRASVARCVARALDELAGPIASISLRTWPTSFPADLATQVRPPWEARVDAIMYRQVLAEVARARGIEVHLYEAKSVMARALELVGPSVLDPGLGPPWTKDHRTALAATVLAAVEG